MSTPELASVNGRITATEEATVPLRDDGLYRGDGAFEVIRLYQGQPFAMEDHFARLSRSASSIQLEFDLAALMREVEVLLAEFGDAEGQLRLMITRGGLRIAVTEELHEHPGTLRVATITYSPTVILNGVKSLSYAANMQATRLAEAQGADEAIFVTPDGIVLEAPTSTIFWVSPQGPLRTTALQAGVLESITRARILDEIEVEQGAFPVADLRACSEAFLAGTSRDVQGISSIDGNEVPNAPGPRTEEAAKAFAAIVKRELEGRS